MAGPWDLTGQNIENTYQRILQTPDGTNFYDGTGSAVTFTATAAAGGSNTQIQFNSASLLSGSSHFSFDYTNNSVLLTGSLDFNANANAIPNQAGRLHWNDTDGTLELGLKGGVVSSLLGQGLVTRVVNKTVPNIDLLSGSYQVVVIGGAQGQRLAVKLAQANNDANSAGTLGLIAEDILKNQEGFIVTVGLLKNRNTTGVLQGETWNDGDILYLSPTTAGAITNIKPQAPQHTVIIGYVEYAHQNNGKIYVKIDNGYELDELHNVRITTASLSTGDLLMYDSGSLLWKNSKTLSGSYTLSGSLTTNDGVSVQSLTASFVSASSITGSLFGTASIADTAYSASIIANNTTNLSYYVPFTNRVAGFPQTGSVQLQTDDTLTWNPFTNVLSGIVQRAQGIDLTETTTGTGPYYLTFSDTTGTGTNIIRTDSTGLTYNATTNVITATSSFATSASFAVSASWAPGATPVTPGGGNTNIQYNNSNAFGGESNFSYYRAGSGNTFRVVRLQNGSPNPDPDTEATEAGLRLEGSSDFTHTFTTSVNCASATTTTIFSLETANLTLGATCNYIIVDTTDFTSIRTGQLYVSFDPTTPTYYLSDTNNKGGNNADPALAIFVLDYSGTLGRVRLQNDSATTLRVTMNATIFTIK